MLQTSQTLTNPAIASSSEYPSVAAWELVNPTSFPQQSNKTLRTIYKCNMAQAVREGVPSLHIT